MPGSLLHVSIVNSVGLQEHLYNPLNLYVFKGTIRLILPYNIVAGTISLLCVSQLSYEYNTVYCWIKILILSGFDQDIFKHLSLISFSACTFSFGPTFIQIKHFIQKISTYCSNDVEIRKEMSITCKEHNSNIICRQYQQI